MRTYNHSHQSICFGRCGAKQLKENKKYQADKWHGILAYLATWTHQLPKPDMPTRCTLVCNFPKSGIFFGLLDAHRLDIKTWLLMSWSKCHSDGSIAARHHPWDTAHCPPRSDGSLATSTWWLLGRWNGALVYWLWIEIRNIESVMQVDGHKFAQTGKGTRLALLWKGATIALTWKGAAIALTWKGHSFPGHNHCPNLEGALIPRFGLKRVGQQHVHSSDQDKVEDNDIEAAQSGLAKQSPVLASAWSRWVRKPRSKILRHQVWHGQAC